MALFTLIPTFTRQPTCSFNISWKYLPAWIKEQEEEGSSVDFSPDFQRSHVWTQEQKNKIY